MHKIYIVGAINEDAYLKFSKHLDSIPFKQHDYISIELASEGGNAYDALCFYGKIKTCKSKIIITAYGVCHSAATLILSAGDIRRVSPECSIMVHQSSATVRGNTSTLVEQSKQEAVEERQWVELLAKETKLTAKQWAKMHAKTTYLTAQDALDAGLVDEILPTKDRKK